MKSNSGKATKCPMLFALSVMRGKWRWVILWDIHQNKTVRFSQLKKMLGKKLPLIADRTLSRQLKELEENGLIQRVQYDEVPLRVEYSLTEKGETIIPVLEHLGKWGASQNKG